MTQPYSLQLSEIKDLLNSLHQKQSNLLDMLDEDKISGERFEFWYEFYSRQISYLQSKLYVEHMTRVVE